MLVKIQYFENEDARTNISEPLNSDANLVQAYIKRNESRTVFPVYANITAALLVHTAIDTTAMNILETESIVIADLYDDEDFSSIVFDISNKATVTKAASDGNTYAVTIQSEDGSNTTTLRVIRASLGTISALPYLYSIRSNVHELTITQPVLTNGLSVGSIAMDQSYIVNDTSVLISIANTTSIEYISSTGTDPDSQFLNDGTTDAMTLVTSRTFTTNEASVLDANYVYLALNHNSNTIYYRLVKNTDYSEDAELVKLKKALSDTYCFLFANSYLVRVDSIDTTTSTRLYRQANAANVLTDLIANNITYYPIGSYYGDLINVTETEAQQAFTTEKAYNVLYQDANTYGFTSTDTENFAKPIGQLLYDLTDVTTYPAAKQYFACMAELTECYSNRTYIDATTKADILSDLLSSYLKEVATLSYMATVLNVRHYRWIQSRLKYMQILQNSGQAEYAITSTNIASIIAMFDQLIAIKENRSISTQLLDTNITLFFNQLQNLKFATNVVQAIKF